MNRKAFALLLVVTIFAALALVGQWDTHRAVSNTQDVVETLQYGALRGDCIREITANAEQQFRFDLTALITIGRTNPAASKQLIDRMTKAAKVNYADVVLEKCPPAIKGR